MTLVLGALDGELADLTCKLSDTRRADWHGYPVYEGLLAADPPAARSTPSGRVERVVVGRTGVGKVQAALLAQHLIDTYRPDRIIMVGVAGSLDPRLAVGDVVIGTATVQHDMDVTSLGFAPGAIPYTDYRLVPCDPDLVALAERVPERGDGAVHTGVIVSGDQFIDDPDLRTRLAATHGALCAEMEGAAVGLVAAVNAIPVLVLRVISDHADGKAANFEKVLDLAADKATYYLTQIIIAMGENDVPRSTE